MRQAQALRASVLAASVASAAAALLTWGPGVSDLPARPGLLVQWLRADPERALTTGAAVGAWLLLGWLALGLLLCGLAAVPGAAGSAAERISRRLVPIAFRRLAGLAVGATVAAGPVLSAGTAFAASPPTVPPPVVAAYPAPAPGNPVPGNQARDPAGGWPDLGRQPAPPSAPAPSGAPAPPSVPPSPPSPAPPSAPAPSGAPAPPSVPPLRPVPPSPAPAPAGPASAYTVRPGDCLWTIAARTLGPGAGPAEIEAAWHRWYEANRDVIGPNPNLIVSGQQLRAAPG